MLIVSREEEDMFWDQQCHYNMEYFHHGPLNSGGHIGFHTPFSGIPPAGPTVIIPLIVLK